jgi:Uma2 family endonuclease
LGASGSAEVTDNESGVKVLLTLRASKGCWARCGAGVASRPADAIPCGVATDTKSVTRIVYEVIPDDEAWALVDEDDPPESRAHRARSTTLEAVLGHRVARTGWDAEVGCNLGLRWDAEHPSWGVAPDVYLMTPKPPTHGRQASLRTWDAGVSPPLVAVEFVSENNGRKDYEIAPDKYAASGTYELWVFDPELLGPRLRGGPHVLQVWRRNESGRFRRVYASDGPAYTEALSAWIVVTDDDLLRVADDEAGARLWPTEAEAERERAEAERERAEAMAARVASLEAELERLRAGG